MAAPPTATSMSANIQNASATSGNDGRDGWDNEDWGSLEEEPANEELEEKNDTNHVAASRSNSNSQSHSSTSVGIYNNNISPTKNNGENNLTTSANSNWDNYGSSWNDDDEFEPIDETGTGEKKYKIIKLKVNNLKKILRH